MSVCPFFPVKQLSSGRFGSPMGQPLLPDYTLEDSLLPIPSRENHWAASYQPGLRSQLVLIKYKILCLSWFVRIYLFICLIKDRVSCVLGWTQTRYVAENGLSPLPECWNYRHAPLTPRVTSAGD